jgi:hypothetical protein
MFRFFLHRCRQTRQKSNPQNVKISSRPVRGESRFDRGQHLSAERVFGGKSRGLHRRRPQQGPLRQRAQRSGERQDRQRLDFLIIFFC